VRSSLLYLRVTAKHLLYTPMIDEGCFRNFLRSAWPRMFPPTLIDVTISKWTLRVPDSSLERSSFTPETNIIHGVGTWVSCGEKLCYFLDIREQYFISGTAVAQWLKYCATNRKVAGPNPDGVIRIFYWHNPSDRNMALESTQPLTEMSTRSISWG
jgi:hypothetical protein